MIWYVVEAERVAVDLAAAESVQPMLVVHDLLSIAAEQELVGIGLRELLHLDEVGVLEQRDRVEERGCLERAHVDAVNVRAVFARVRAEQTVEVVVHDDNTLFFRLFFDQISIHLISIDV